MGVSSLLQSLSWQQEPLPIWPSFQSPYMSLKTYICMFLNSRSKGPSGQSPQYRQPIKWVPKKKKKKRQFGKLSLALIIGKVLFLFCFVLILGVMHSRTFFNRILCINNAFWGLQDDFIYVNKTEVVVVWFDHVTVYVRSWHLLYLHPIKKDWQLCGFSPSCLWDFGSFLSPL